MEVNNYVFDYFDMSMIDHTSPVELNSVTYFYVESGGFVEYEYEPIED